MKETTTVCFTGSHILTFLSASFLRFTSFIILTEMPDHFYNTDNRLSLIKVELLGRKDKTVEC